MLILPLILRRSTLGPRGPDARARRPHRRLQSSAGPVLPDGAIPSAAGHPLPRGAGVEGRVAGPHGQELVRRGVPGARSQGDATSGRFGSNFTTVRQRELQYPQSGVHNRVGKRPLSPRRSSSCRGGERHPIPVTNDQGWVAPPSGSDHDLPSRRLRPLLDVRPCPHVSGLGSGHRRRVVRVPATPIMQWSGP